MNTDFEHLYIYINISDKQHEILSFTYLPVVLIEAFYDKINDVEDFVKQSLYLIHLSLKNPTEFNKIKTTITFDELHKIMEQWVKYSIYYTEWANRNIDSNGEPKPKIKLKQALAELLTLIESEKAATEEEHLFFIEKLSDTIQEHAKQYNKITAEPKISKITIEVNND